MCFSKALVAKPINQLDQPKQILNLWEFPVPYASVNIYGIIKIVRVEECNSGIWLSNKILLTFYFHNFDNNLHGKVSVDGGEGTQTVVYLPCGIILL